MVELVPHVRGHIHDTFISTWERGGKRERFLHQRMNTNVFRDIPALMHNIERVTDHLERTRDPAHEMEALRLVRTRDGAHYLDHDSGQWRTYHYVADTVSFDLCESEDQAYRAARAFGVFQERLLDLPAEELREPLPSFFSTPFRLEQLDRALAEDVEARVRTSRPEIEFVEARRSMAGVMEEGIATGRFPSRVVHGDTKLNNVLFDRETGRARCIVDLDTCMAGYSLYDFGDLVRFTAATSAEDEVDLQKAGMDLGLYRALVRGYLEGAGSFLTAEELKLMPIAARLVTLTIGVRFLTDHLAGDVYFKISRPGHNLDRARVQFAMVADMEAKQAEMLVAEPA